MRYTAHPGHVRAALRERRIHLGHLVEYIQTDIWVRFQKMCGHEVHYVCADDTHGTAIMLRAEKEGITPRGAHRARAGGAQAGLRGLPRRVRQLLHDAFGGDARAFRRIYPSLKAADLIDLKPVEQFYDPVKEMFLPDRFIKGECPKCGAKDQYGDSCEVCGSTYTPDRSDRTRTRSSPAPRPSAKRRIIISSGSPIRAARTSSNSWTQDGRPSAARSAQQDPRMVRPGPRRLGHLARRAVLRVRDSRRSRQVSSTSGSTRRSAISGASGISPSASGLDFDTFVRAGSDRRDGALHRQGHPVFPRAVLAGHAAGSRAIARRPMFTRTASSP